MYTYELKKFIKRIEELSIRWKEYDLNIVKRGSAIEYVEGLEKAYQQCGQQISNYLDNLREIIDFQNMDDIASHLIADGLTDQLNKFASGWLKSDFSNLKNSLNNDFVDGITSGYNQCGEHLNTFVRHNS
jgi:hypothetical protein